MLRFGRKQQNSIKQLLFYKKNKLVFLKKKKKIRPSENPNAKPLFLRQLEQINNQMERFKQQLSYIFENRQIDSKTLRGNFVFYFRLLGEVFW